MSYTKVTARGLKGIVDGRVFVIREGVRLGDPKFELTTPVEIIEPVTPASPMSCSVCGQTLARQLIRHNMQWMFTLFACTDHPYTAVYLDIFPKVYPDTTHEWINSFMGMDTGQEQFIGIIGNMAWPEEQLKEYLDQATREAELTPEGLTFVNVASRPVRSLQSLLRRLRSA